MSLYYKLEEERDIVIDKLIIKDEYSILTKAYFAYLKENEP